MFPAYNFPINKSKNTNCAITLFELIMAMTMFAIIAVVVVFIFRAVLLGWDSLEKQAGMRIVFNTSTERLVRDLRQAREISVINNEIRFTQDGVNYYVYYLYNTGNSYKLMKANISGGINGVFTSGSGQLIALDITAPPASSLSVNGNVIIDLSMSRGSEVMRVKTNVKPRNL